MLVILTSKENDHAGQRNRSRTKARRLEQGQTDRSQAAAAAETRLVDPHQAPDSRPQARSTGRPKFKVLPVELPSAPVLVGIVTLKNRTLSPAARLFIEYAREVAKRPARRK
jgi:DNA-binding transcriptional LysR family regulator